MTMTAAMEHAVQELYRTDAAFDAELVRVYGKAHISVARYYRNHADPGVQQAADAYHAAGQAYHDTCEAERRTA